MKAFRHIVSRSLKASPVILVIELAPSMARAHTGLEPSMPYVTLLGLLVGVVTGTICAIWHLSLRNALLSSFCIYLVVLMVGGFFLLGGMAGGWVWSDVPDFLIIGIVAGGVGFIPLSLGAITMSFILNRVIDIVNKLRKKP